MDNFRKKIIDVKIIRKYLNEEKYISVYNYMTHQHDQYIIKNNFFKKQKIYINVLIIKKIHKNIVV